MTWEELKKSLDSLPDNILQETATFEGEPMKAFVKMTGENEGLDITERKKHYTVFVGGTKIIVSWFPKD